MATRTGQIFRDKLSDIQCYNCILEAQALETTVSELSKAITNP